MAAMADKQNGSNGTPSGFRAQLSGAALADLVQLEYYARNTRTVRVTSNKGIGYLFFRGGDIVHAVTGEAEGETAAFEILNWREGTFEPCQLTAPPAATISIGAQELLLRAAHAHDESCRKIPLTKPESVSSANRLSQNEVPAMKFAAKPPIPPPPISRVAVTRDLVRLDRAGNLISAQGNSELLAPVAAYAARMGDLIGDMLGLGAWVGVEAELGSEHVFVHAEKSGHLVAVRTSHDKDISQVRERFGL